ncbi:hypothetical protein ADEAN_000259900 [Angomonas deanei]|uniref:BRO1-like domain containing protein n=1 Tax=Angomonas deanei TaxID=59799 RepID=A0A7G2C5W1_9TRYP|nr:hypothetical protein ADEAN_000259900 [Angomonas deanei]
MFVPHPALREHAFSWTNGVKKSLGFLHINTVPPRVLNALTMIDTYGCATKKMSHEKEDVCHVASLLLALDLHLGSWPEVLQQQVQVTPVTLNGVTIHVSRPLIEAVIVLYNGAIALLEHGLELLSHVRADAVRRTSLAGSSGLPNVNAKRAFQSITAAQELAEMADHTLRSGKERNLSKAEQTSLTAHLDLSTLRDTCVVCAASAKYIFALSSAATATNPEALSKLAFIAASYSIPERLPNTSTLKLLPTVLLAAFHVHRGEQYYAEEEMGKALGHIQYANRILLNTTEEAVKSQQFHQSSWRSVLTAVKKVLSVKGGDGSLTFECDDDASEEVQKAAEAYTKLAKIVENSDDILRVLPYFHILLKTQFNLLCKYEKENKVVYFEKTLPADTVRRDVPDIEALVPTTGDIKTITVSQQSTDALKELPSEQELLYLLTQQSEREKAIQNTARLVRGLEGVMNTVTSKVELPAEAGDALHQLEPCLQEHNSTVEGALQLAQEELQTAYDAYETAVEQWQTAKGGKKTSHPTQKAVDAAVNLWSKDTEKILASWSQVGWQRSHQLGGHQRSPLPRERLSGGVPGAGDHPAGGGPQSHEQWDRQ